MGQDIPRKAEEEQAAVLYWMLSLYLEHGNIWREEGQKILKAEIDKIKSESPSEKENDQEN